MLKTIIANSPELVAFIAGLQLSLSKPQLRHVLNVVDSLIVGEGHKTLSALSRLFVRRVNPKNMADTFRESPWQAEDIRQPLKRFLIRTVFEMSKVTRLKHIVYLSIDDSMAVKHKDTRHLEGIDWYHDHTASRPGQPVYRNGLIFVLLRLHVGPSSFTIDLRPYVREKTVRRLNCQRPKEKRLKFRTKYALARTMLAEVKPLIPKGYRVIVLFDSWYASAKLLKWCRRQHWHVICALKSNRCLNGVQVRDHHQRLKHQRYTRVTLTAADERRHIYLVRSVTGRLNDVPGEVRVFISKRHRRDRKPRYYLSTDLSLSAQTALSRYTKRWPVEVANFYLKVRLGLTDFRLRSFEAIEKYLVVSWLAMAFLEWRRAVSTSHHSCSLADMIRLQRHEHARQTLRAACEMAIQTGDVEAVLTYFAPAPT
jgi:hypothetical protein